MSSAPSPPYLAGLSLSTTRTVKGFPQPIQPSVRASAIHIGRLRSREPTEFLSGSPLRNETLLPSLHFDSRLPVCDWAFHPFVPHRSATFLEHSKTPDSAIFSGRIPFPRHPRRPPCKASADSTDPSTIQSLSRYSRHDHKAPQPEGLLFCAGLLCHPKAINGGGPFSTRPLWKQDYCSGTGKPPVGTLKGGALSRRDRFSSRAIDQKDHSFSIFFEFRRRQKLPNSAEST